MIEKLIESLATITRIHGGVHEFAQVLDSRVGFRRVLFFEKFDVAGSVDKKFQDVGGGWSRGEAFIGDFRCRRAFLERLGFGFGIETGVYVFIGGLFFDCFGSEIEAEIVGTEVGIIICVADGRDARSPSSASGFFSRALLHAFGVGARQHGPAIFDQISESFSVRLQLAAAGDGA